MNRPSTSTTNAKKDIGVVYNVFEAVDVITLIKGGVYDDLSLTVGEALKKRSPVCLPFLHPRIPWCPRWLN